MDIACDNHLFYISTIDALKAPLKLHARRRNPPSQQALVVMSGAKQRYSTREATVTNLKSLALKSGAALFCLAFGCPAANAAENCSALAGTKLENVDFLSATEVPATGELPAYCRVLGFVRPAINFDIRLPSAGGTANSMRSAAAVIAGLSIPILRASPTPPITRCAVAMR
jgi:hypothetical protein